MWSETVGPRDFSVGLDTARVFAATTVLVQHGVLATFGVGQPLRRAADYLGPASGVAVNLFFVLSGYLLLPPLLKNGFSWSFVFRRLRRLVPLYLLVGSFMALVITLHDGRVPVDALKSHVFFASLFTGSFLFGPAWTICVEFWFVFLMPPLAWACRRVALRPSWLPFVLVFAGIAAEVTARALVAMADRPLEMHVKPIAGLLPVAWGAALSVWTEDGQRRRNGEHLALVAGTACWVVMCATSPGPRGDYVVTAGSVLVLAGLRNATVGKGSLGKYTYGLYLWHYPLLCTFFVLAFGGLPGQVVSPGWGIGRAIGWTLLLLLVTSLVSWGTYRFVERPILGWRPRRLR